MCELLFKHVGEFREHATDIFTEIVDDMHKPNSALRPVDASKLNNKKTGPGYSVFMDENDKSLYFSGDNIIKKLGQGVIPGLPNNSRS